MEGTKERILGAASALFAGKGFAGTTVRAICAAAGVNVALVNYHFKSKEGLYEACIQRIFAIAGGPRLATLDKGVKDQESWRKAVTAWVRGIARALHEQSAAGSGPVWAFRQEVTRPSPMFGYLKERFALPVFDCFKRLMMMAASTEREALLWVTSVWSQVSAVALVDSRWQDVFRPAGATKEGWGRAFTEFVLSSLFKELKYHG